MKDIVDAFSERAKGPYFGYVVTSFIFINWKAVFFLFASDKSIEYRILYFENASSIESLVIQPLVFGAIATLIYPWSLLIFQFFSQIPISLSNRLLLSAEHKSIVKRTELERARNEQFSEIERDLLDSAKRDEELESIQNDETREKLRTDLETVRAEKNRRNNYDSEIKIDEAQFDKELLTEDFRMLSDSVHTPEEMTAIENFGIKLKMRGIINK